MGNQDNWTTPKQIKIEREGEPKGTRRGPLKKGERRKGKKARMDEVLQAMKDAERYKKWYWDEQKRMKEHPEWYKPQKGLLRWEPHYRQWFEKAVQKLNKLVAKAVEDGVLTELAAEHYEVELGE